MDKGVQYLEIDNFQKLKLKEKQNFLSRKDLPLLFGFISPLKLKLFFLSFLLLFQSSLETVSHFCIILFIQVLFDPSAFSNNTLSILGFQFHVKGLTWLNIPNFLTITIVIHIFLFIIDYYRNHHTQVIQALFVENIRAEALRKLLKLEIGYFSSTRSGEVNYLMTIIIGRFNSLIKTISDFVSHFLNFLIVLFLLFRVSPELTLFVITLGTLTWLSLGFLLKRVRDVSLGVSELSSTTVAIIQEIIYGIKLIKMSALEALEEKKYLSSLYDLLEKQVHVVDVQCLIGIIGRSAGIIILLLAAGLTQGTSYFRNLSKTDLLGYMYLLSRTLPYLLGMVNMRSTWVTMNPYLAQILNFIYSNPWPEEQTHAQINSKLEIERIERIECRELEFSYDKQPVLQGITINVEKNKAIGITGLSGSGKSTLFDLLTGFRTPQSGGILINNHPLSTINIATFRKKIGYASQETIVFHETLKKNICYMTPDATQEKLYEALESATITSFLPALPQGLDTLVGERGLNLSGGQRQRIALARIFLQNPDVILLDEATNALDLSHEEQIIRNFLQLKENKIFLFVTHRVHSLRHFDEIIVLHNGEILEQGNHEELIDKKGLYEHLYYVQEAKSATFQRREEGSESLVF